MENIISVNFCDSIVQKAVQELFDRTKLETSYLWPQGTTWSVNGTNWGSDPCEDVKVVGYKTYAFNLPHNITGGRWDGKLGGLPTKIAWKQNICTASGDVWATPYLSEKSNYRGQDGFKAAYIGLTPKVIGKLEPLVRLISDEECLALFDNFAGKHSLTPLWTFATSYAAKRKSLIDLLGKTND